MYLNVHVYAYAYACVDAVAVVDVYADVDVYLYVCLYVHLLMNMHMHTAAFLKACLFCPEGSPKTWESRQRCAGLLDYTGVPLGDIHRLLHLEACLERASIAGCITITVWSSMVWYSMA